jgi:predicted RNA-binding Zn-ribbon protein involved in translation (DUF1610 family)
MTDTVPGLHWAPRVSREKVRRLYETDAKGLVDEEQIDEVGWGLYSRCRSIITATSAMHGRVECPRCGRIIFRPQNDEDHPLQCPDCDWATSWKVYRQSFRHQQLCGGDVSLFEQYVHRWERSREPRERMLLIDWLIHRWHWEARANHMLGRPTGVTLIEGSINQVLVLLNELTHGTADTPVIAEAREAWLNRLSTFDELRHDSSGRRSGTRTDNG